MKNKIMKKLKQIKPRDTWNTAVKLYAIELLDQYEEKEELTEEVLLAGAADWNWLQVQARALRQAARLVLSLKD